MKKKNFLVILCCFLISSISAQQHGVSSSYVTPDDPLVIQNLEDWQDLKFGLMMHWGTYSQWGVVESWSICPEDEGWTQRNPKHGKTYFEYLQNYENLQKTFNPVDFNPEKWAKAAKSAGMRYLVFTTKHHDGFSMFDTKETDYKITSPNTPFSTNPKANIAKEIFNTFREDGFKIGAYFSKPDWHSADYWWPYVPPKDRNVNYDPAKYPDRWKNFKDFTYNQINELTTDYGRVDILWLDGGWVRPNRPSEEGMRNGKPIRFNQDIDMDKIGGMARKNQPGILVVDRTVEGKWENYVTPEQTIPEKPLGIPWESCITMGNSWSYVPNDHYKSAQKIVGTLIQIISKGGNYLLNIGPSPRGDFDPKAYDRLQKVGEWMSVNSDAVYATRAVAPYNVGDYYYTQSKDGSIVNVFHSSEGEDYVAPEALEFQLPDGFQFKKLSVLGIRKGVKWKKNGNTVTVKLPKDRTNLKYATVVRMTP